MTRTFTWRNSNDSILDKLFRKLQHALKLPFLAHVLDAHAVQPRWQLIGRLQEDVLSHLYVFPPCRIRVSAVRRMFFHFCDHGVKLGQAGVVSVQQCIPAV